MNSPVGPVQVDFTVIDMSIFLDVDDDKASFPEERKVFDMAKCADSFYFFMTEKMSSQAIAIECMKKCNNIFDEETPKAVIGGNAEGFIKRKKEKPVLPAFRQLVKTTTWLSSISFHRRMTKELETLFHLYSTRFFTATT
eukprot:scaffold162125_cov78-Attheya_sp.AAC.5